MTHLKHNSKQLHNHCSWTLQEHDTPCWKTLFQHTQLFKKPYQEESCNHTLQWIERWNEYTWKENAEIWLRPVEQIAHIVTTPPTKQEQAQFLVLKNLTRTRTYSLKRFNLCCKTCFLNLIQVITNSPFYKKHFITDF